MGVSPGLSVLIVTYNRSAELRRCLDSVLSQSQQPDEIVVIDNASSDDTGEMISAYGAGIRYVRSKQNLGCPAGRNRGIALSRYSHVLCVDDDGTLEPGAIEAVFDALSAYPGAAVVAGHVIDNFHAYPASTDCVPTFTFSGGIACVDRSVFLALGGYHEDGMRQGEEPELSYSLFASGRLVVRQPALRLLHHVVETDDRWRSIVRSGARQTILTGFKKVPWWLLPGWLVAKQPAQIVHAVKRGHCPDYARGLIEGVVGVPEAVRARSVTSYAAVLAGTRLYKMPTGTID